MASTISFRISQRLDASLDELMKIAARLSNRDEMTVVALGHRLLAIPPKGVTLGGVSQLNNDGTPLQLCLSMSEKNLGVRLIADPAWRLGLADERFEASLESFNAASEESSEESGAVEMRPLLQRLIDLAKPLDKRVVDQFTRGFFWIGRGLNQPGVAVYHDTKPYGDSAWALAARWLKELLPDARIVDATLDRLREHVSLASVGLEGARAGEARAKIYWRLKTPVRLSALGIDLLDDSAFALFLAEAIGQRDMRLSGTVMSLGFDLSNGEIEDVKIDLCGHCLPQSPREWLTTLDELSETFGLSRFPVYDEILEEGCEVAFLGLGLNRRGQKRLNLYLKPPRQNQSIYDSINNAVDYLLDLQRSDGAWDDYQLPVGRATQWVTAFVGQALADASSCCNRPEARAAAVQAARWLNENRSYAAGWGYNSLTGVDADSTGLAIRLFRKVGLPVEPRDEQRLLAQWREGGGFATYDGPENWGAAHPCVTAVAFLALAPEDRRRLSPELRHYLHRAALPDGTWPAYWWRNHYYSTYHHLILLRELGLRDSFAPTIAETVVPYAASDFEFTYALGIEHLRDPSSPKFNDLLARLLARQHADGGWSGGYNLRVTDPSCARPWEEARGSLYRDMFNTITTGSAVMVLAEVARDSRF
jgi:hypothetical protein